MFYAVKQVSANLLSARGWNGELPSYVPEEQGSFKSTVVPLTHSW